MRVESRTDGRVFEGSSAEEIVASMRDADPNNRDQGLATYMQNVRQWIAEEIDVATPASFLRSLAELGYVHVDEEDD